MNVRFVQRVTIIGSLVAAAIVAACSRDATSPSDARRSTDVSSSSSNAKGGGTIIVTVDGASPAGDSGAPVPLQYVAVQIFHVDGGDSTSTFLNSDSTSQNGTARFTQLKTGTYAFRILPTSNMYGPDSVQNVKVKGNATVNVKVVLPIVPGPSGPGSITGIVAGAGAGDSVPGDTTHLVNLAGAIVTAYQADSGQHRVTVGVDTTASAGGFTFKNLNPGTYVLYATPPNATWAAESAAVSVTPGSATYTEILLPRR